MAMEKEGFHTARWYPLNPRGRQHVPAKWTIPQ
jgi:hypothetical protein